MLQGSRCRWIASAVLVALFLVTFCGSARPADWPAYGRDAARSCVTAESLAWPLAQAWSFRPEFAPAPAWGDPKPGPVEGILELRRVHFDDVFHAAVAEGSLYFGSSSDNKIYALDAATGRVRWTKITGGPVRLAPWVEGGRVYAGSDDGHVYCLRAADGAVVWDFHAAPDDRRVLGHGRMISLWPVRTGVLVDGGVAYFAAGIFPAEGVFFYAVDAATGKEIWRNDSAGEQPLSRISPQGYLLASRTTLYAPMGRVSPAALDRQTGQVTSTPYFGKTVGGTNTVLDGEQVFTGTEEIVGFLGKQRLGNYPARKIVLDGPRAYLATGERLLAIDRQTYPAASHKLFTLKAKKESARNALAGLRKTRGALTREIAQLTDELKETQQAHELEAMRSELAAKQPQLDACLRREQEQAEAMAAMDGEIAQAEADVAAMNLWSVPCACDQALVLAGDVLVAGGDGLVQAFRTSTGEQVWSAEVNGSAKGLAVADARLYVSTDKGFVCCFAASKAASNGGIAASEAVGKGGIDTEGAQRDATVGKVWQDAAEAILAQSGVRRGYCLVMGCEEGDLAIELARRSELTVYAVGSDAHKVAAARAKVDEAGLYGGRICVEQWPEGKIPYADYFANLIVSQRAMAGGELPDAEELFRMLKPAGGVAMIGAAEAGPGAARLRAWLEEAKLLGARLVGEQGPWARVDRGTLPGGGSWTHEYGNPGNTACGDDRLVRAPLGVLWFGGPGPQHMPSRHARAAAPLSADGRMFCQGENHLMAYDAYNGVMLWERELRGAFRPNASHDGSNLALARLGLLVAVGNRCLRLDPATGKTLAEYAMPKDDEAGGAKPRWGVVACVGDTLYGSRSRERSLESDCVFAIDLKTGRSLWAFASKGIPHNSIAIDGGRVFVVDRQVTAGERKAVIERTREQIGDLPESERAAARRALHTADVRRVVALDARTGKLAWEQVVDLTHCGAVNLAAMAGRDALVLFGVYLDGHYWKDFFAGQFAPRRVTVLAQRDGRMLWSRPVGYRVRPLVIGDTLQAEPWAFDLRTGEPRTRVNPITGQTENWQFARPGHHCGCPNGTANCLFFRSYAIGYYDLVSDSGTMHFGAQRPGCWINFIPAGGLLLVPEASTGCMCPFPNMCTVVFQPTSQRKGFAYYSVSGPTMPVRRLALNFGAPGDRKDSQGNLWLGYPRPGGSLVLPMRLDLAYLPGGGPVMRNSSYTPIAGSEDPWIFTSAARGVKSCTLPLADAADGKGLYRVRLAFSDPDNDRPGRRVFDVKLQGRRVLAGLDIAREAGGRDRALVKEFDGVEVTDKLAIELVSRSKKPKLEQAPILAGVEVVRQRVLSLGWVVPAFELSDASPKQAEEIRMANFRDEAFAGKLEIGTVEGLSVSPASSAVALAPGQRATLPLEVSGGKDLARGVYTLPARLLRADGSLEAEQEIRVENLGSRGRVILRAVEDASVMQRFSEQNRGTDRVLPVDGGDAVMGDLSHSAAYLKFRLEVPGKIVNATLRIQNAGNPSSSAGRVCLVETPWNEETITYTNRPKPGRELVRLGAVAEGELVERTLDVDLTGKQELSLVIDPTSNDGVDYVSREGARPPELVVEYEAEQ